MYSCITNYFFHLSFNSLMNSQIYSKTVNFLKIKYSKIQPSIKLTFSIQKLTVYTWTSHINSVTLLTLNQSLKTSKTGKTTSMKMLNMTNHSQILLMIRKIHVISLLLKENPSLKAKRTKQPLVFNLKFTLKRFKITVLNFLIFMFKIKS